MTIRSRRQYENRIAVVENQIAVVSDQTTSVSSIIEYENFSLIFLILAPVFNHTLAHIQYGVHVGFLAWPAWYLPPLAFIDSEKLVEVIVQSMQLFFESFGVVAVVCPGDDEYSESSVNLALLICCSWNVIGLRSSRQEPRGRIWRQHCFEIAEAKVGTPRQRSR